jgi:hypothetical protein
MPDPARRLVGALIGGVVGFALTWLLWSAGVMLLAAAGGGVAIGAGSRRLPRSLPWTIGITALALAVAVFTAWFFTPFTADPSLGYFVANLAATGIQTKIALAITAALGIFYGGSSGPPARVSRPADLHDGDGLR